MIVLLSCSTKSLSQNNHSSTGRLDSVKIAVDDIRLANAKLIQLQYEQEINKELKEIVRNDSIIIEKVRYDNNSLSTKINKVKTQRNIAVGSTSILLLLILLKLL